MRPEQAAPASLAGLARESGGLAMVAMNHRESLRTVLADASAGTGAPPATDQMLLDVKLDVASALGPFASGFLIDREIGFEQVRDQHLLPSSTGLIVAADALICRTAGTADGPDLDALFGAGDFDLSGVTALELSLTWRRDDQRQARVELARRFAELAGHHQVLSVLKTVVRPSDDELDDPAWDRAAAVRDAAADLSVVGQSLYIVQVPFGGARMGQELDEECHLLGTCIAGPWVVESHGVSAGSFPDAVTAACRAGASGFLAGQALWADVVGRADLRLALHEVSVPRLRRLAQIVDEHARPWAVAVPS